MKEFFELTEKFVRKIEEMEKNRIEIGKILRNLSLEVCGLLEERLVFRVKEDGLEDLRVAGIDGGLVKHSLHGVDLLLLRAIGVIFDFKGGKLNKIDYYPDACPSPIPKVVFEPFTDLEFELSSNYERQIAEIQNAIEVVEKFKPNLLLLDGSIVPHYAERPSKTSILFPTFEKMIESYSKLYSRVERKGVVLAGVVEDSRGKRFCQILNEQVLPKHPIPLEMKPFLDKTRDTNLLIYTLKLGERSFVFKYSSNPLNHPILREFGEVADFIYSFYLKTAEFDRPLRIDFLAPEKCIEKANFISSVLLALAGHSGYGIPSVLIEADQRAKLSERDLELFYSSLLAKLGNLPSLFSLRREQRPF